MKTQSFNVVCNNYSFEFTLQGSKIHFKVYLLYWLIYVEKNKFCMVTMYSISSYFTRKFGLMLGLFNSSITLSLFGITGNGTVNLFIELVRCKLEISERGVCTNGAKILRKKYYAKSKVHLSHPKKWSTRFN